MFPAELDHRSHRSISKTTLSKRTQQGNTAPIGRSAICTPSPCTAFPIAISNPLPGSLRWSTLIWRIVPAVAILLWRTTVLLLRMILLRRSLLMLVSLRWWPTLLKLVRIEGYSETADWACELGQMSVSTSTSGLLEGSDGEKVERTCNSRPYVSHPVG